MKKISLAIVFILLSIFTLSAQGRYAVISGKVTDVEAGGPLAYASVLLSPSGQYTMTDSKGNFSFVKVAAGYVVVKVEFYGKIAQQREFDAMAGGQYTWKRSW